MGDNVTLEWITVERKTNFFIVCSDIAHGVLKDSGGAFTTD